MAMRDVNNDASSRAVNMARVEGEFVGKGLMSSTKNAGKMWGDSFGKSTQSLGTKWGNTFGEVVGTVVNRAVKEGAQSFNRVTSNFLKDYDAITARLNKNFHEYRQYYNDLNSQLRETGMNIAFSMKDVTTEMMNNLSVGMRGAKLEEKTISDLIVKKLVPSINTNTRGYTTLYKKLGDSFTQTQVALAKYSESLIGLEAMERGDIQSTMDSLNLDLMYSAKIGGLDTNKVMAGLQSVLYAAGSSEYGSDYLAGKFEEIIKGEMTPDSPALMQQLGVSNGEELAKMLSSPALTKQLVERIAEYSKSFMGIGGGGKLIAGAISGGSTEDAVRGVVADEFVEAYKKLDMKNFDAEKVYAKAESDALAGYFNTPSEKLENFEDSIMNDVGTLAAGIPHMSDLIGDIGGILTSVSGMIINAIYASRIAGKAGGGAGGAVRGGAHAAKAGLGSSLVTGASVLGGAAVAGWGISSGIKDFKEGNNWAGGFELAGAGLGVAGGIAALASTAAIPVVGPILVAAGAATIGLTKAIKHWTNTHATLDNIFKGIADSAKTASEEWVGQIHQNYKDLTEESDIRKQLIQDGFDETEVNKLNVKQLEDFKNALVGVNNVSANAEIDKMTSGLAGEFSSLVERKDFRGLAEFFKTVKSTNGEKDAISAMTSFANATMGDNTEAWIAELNKQASNGGLSNTDINQLMYGNWFGKKYSADKKVTNLGSWNDWASAWGYSGTLNGSKVNALNSVSAVVDDIADLKLAYYGADAANKSIIASRIADILTTNGITPGTPGASSLGLTGIINGYRNGLDYVPYDNYPALLHEGEAVLTKGESSKFRSVLTALGLSSTLSVSNAGTEVVDIMSTIATKIDSLGNVLDSILQVIVDIADGQNTTNIVPTNRNLTNYSGGAIE